MRVSSDVCTRVANATTDRDQQESDKVQDLVTLLVLRELIRRETQAGCYEKQHHKGRLSRLCQSSEWRGAGSRDEFWTWKRKWTRKWKWKWRCRRPRYGTVLTREWFTDPHASYCLEHMTYMDEESKVCLIEQESVANVRNNGTNAHLGRTDN